MGRAALGAAKKSRTAAVRLTESQAKVIESRYGTVGRFLQIAVNQELEKESQK